MPRALRQLDSACIPSWREPSPGHALPSVAADCAQYGPHAPQEGATHRRSRGAALMKGSVVKRKDKGGKPAYYVVIDERDSAGKRRRRWRTDPATGKAFTTRRAAEA